MSITVTVSGGKEIAACFMRIRDQVRVRMVAVMDTFGTGLVGYIRQNKLSGQVLNQRTGHLSRAVNNRTETTDTRVASVVGVNLREAAYGRAHEYGFNGTVTVNAHTRMMTMVFGKKVAPHEVMVREHTMKMNVRERSYMRTSLREEGPAGVQSVREALIGLLRESRA